MLRYFEKNIQVSCKQSNQWMPNGIYGIEYKKWIVF